MAAGVQLASGEQVASLERFWPYIRSEHLEWPRHPGGEIIHCRRLSYEVQPRDLDPDRVGLHHKVVSFFIAAAMSDADVVEVAEPLWVRETIINFGVLVAVRLGRVVRRKPQPIVIAYCLENSRPSQLAGVRSPRLNRFIVLMLRYWLRLQLRLISRVAFGTEDSAATYGTTAGREPIRPPHKTILALQKACECLPHERQRGLVLFVSELHPRKGFDVLARIWPTVHGEVPYAQLTICGVGPLRPLAIELAARDEVQYLERPPRPEIHGWLRRASVVFMFSRKSGRWSEQVGLPIVEGLAHGADILTSDLTGLAGWLEQHDLAVLRENSTDDTIAQALIERLASRHDPQIEPQIDLPIEDARMTAQRWLINGS